jgi:hypothetical protein
MLLQESLALENILSTHVGNVIMNYMHVKCWSCKIPYSFNDILEILWISNFLSYTNHVFYRWVQHDKPWNFFRKSPRKLEEF